MKRTLLLFLTAALLSALVGCQTPDEKLPPVVTEGATEAVHESETETEAVSEVENETETEEETEDQSNTDTKEPAETTAHDSETTASALDSPPNDGTDEDFQYCDAVVIRGYYDDVETMLSDDKLAQILFNRETELNGGSGDNSTMNTDHTYSFPYPVLKSPDFGITQIWIDDDGFHYTCMPYNENGDLIPFYWGRIGFWIDFIPDVSLWDGVAADYDGYHYYVYDDSHAYDELDSEFCIDFPNMGYLRVRFPYASPDDRIVTLEGLYSYFDFEIHTCTYSPNAETGAVQ